jgi:hypothetical protein
MASKQDSDRNRRIAGGIAALTAVTTIGSAMTLSHCRQSGIQPTATQKLAATQGAQSSDLEKLHLSRLSDNLSKLSGVDSTSYLLSEIYRAAATRSRGMVDDEQSVLYYNYQDYRRALQQVIRPLPMNQRAAIMSRLTGRMNDLDLMHEGYEKTLGEMFTDAFPKDPKAATLLESQENLESVRNETVRTLHEMVDWLSQQLAKERAEGRKR